MPTFISHAVVGLAGGSLVAGRGVPRRFWVLAAVVPVLADLDVIAFALGIPYHHPLGHRGLFHSLALGLVLGLAAAAIFMRPGRLGWRRWGLLAGVLALLGASHGPLDAMTDGGLGVALFAPFDFERIFFPFQPIRVSPIGLRSFLSQRGLEVMASEILWVWLPCLGLAGLAWGARRLWRRRDGDQPSD